MATLDANVEEAEAPRVHALAARALILELVELDLLGAEGLEEIPLDLAHVLAEQEREHAVEVVLVGARGLEEPARGVLADPDVIFRSLGTARQHLDQPVGLLSIEALEASGEILPSWAVRVGSPLGIAYPVVGLVRFQARVGLGRRSRPLSSALARDRLGLGRGVLAVRGHLGAPGQTNDGTVRRLCLEPKHR